MRYSQSFLPTVKEVPAEAEIASHKLMLRAGLIRKLASGIYSYLPLGLRTLRKIERVVREEMVAAGAQEVLLPGVQPAELWRESGRWAVYGPELLRLRDRHARDFCLGPTHEEVITDLVRREVKSYRQLPVNLFQIQTKFRDEIRPRFGVMRAREFVMKDGYSFHADEPDAERTYRRMFDAYSAVFSRLGLGWRAVEADTGSIGGSFSHEFMVLAQTGEDLIVACASCAYAANLEKAECPPPSDHKVEPTEALQKVATPGMKTVEEVCGFLKVASARLVKTLLYSGPQGPLAVMVRGDHEVNEAKLRAFLRTDAVELAGPEVVERLTGAPVGFAGPVGLKVPAVADVALQGQCNFIVGANEADAHFINVNFGRDVPVPQFVDLHVFTPREGCPRCGGGVEFMRGIEVGHVFKLGTKYSKAMNAVFLDAEGAERPMIMGCYGLGVSRIMAAAIEQNHDADGIIWPMPIAPFQVVIVPTNFGLPEIREVAENLYAEMISLGIEVLLDDRDERAGVKFKDADLIGIPLRVTVGPKGLAKGEVEIKFRAGGEVRGVGLKEAPEAIRQAVLDEVAREG
ncbi:MAG: proline--tRNA ligase [Pseudomonadota bacterium]